MTRRVIKGQSAEMPQEFTELPPREDVLILKREDRPNHQAYLPIAQELRRKLPAVAHRIMNGTPFSESAMTGTGRPLTRSEFQMLRDIFLQQQLCAWKDPEHHTLGVRFTGYGRSFLRQEAERSTTPPRIRTPRTPAALPSYSEGRWEE